MKKHDCAWWYRHGLGSSVADVAGDPEDIEQFVDLIRRMTRARLDWGYTGGTASLDHLGFRSSRLAVELALIYLPVPPRIMVRRTYCRYACRDKVAMAFDAARGQEPYERIYPA